MAHQYRRTTAVAAGDRAALGFKPGRITTIADARTIGRSPTQVAMPIIDRWLDQAPERLHLLADALVHRSVRGEKQRRAVAEWRGALVELRKATNEFNGDGVPVAIEGFELLPLTSMQPPSLPTAKRLLIATRLRELADRNQGYERTEQELEDFRLWAPAARRDVEELEQLTAARVGPPR